MPDDRYWLADDIEKAVPAIDERVEDYYRFVQSSGMLDLWRAANRACFSGFYTGGEIGKLGKQGEFKTLEVNDIGNLQQHLFNMLTAQRPAFEARTETVSASAMQQAPLGVAVAETAFREKGLEKVALDVADTMLRAGEGWGLKRWDPNKGEPYTSEPVLGEDGKPAIGEDGKPIMAPVMGGDETYRALHPLDVARDPSRLESEQTWRVSRRKVPRWDLVAEFPDLADKIKAAPSVFEVEGKRPVLVETERWFAKRDLVDDVWVYDMFADDGPALEGGREITYVSTDCVLFDGPLPYRRSPLYRCAAKELEGTPFGYTLLWDLLAPQMALNNVLSQITTLASKLSAVVWEPDGLGGSPMRWQNVLTVLKGGTVAPQVLDLLKIPAELFRLVDFYVTAMERTSGINAVYRGQTAEGQKNLSGAAYALFAARAIEFGSRLQGAYNRFLEDIATGTVHDYQDMGNGRYLVSLMGEGNAYRVQEFQAGAEGDIAEVSKIGVRLTNPLQTTTAGRMQMFDSLKEIPGAITTPESAVQVLMTGKLEPATQSTQRELENIAKENERLMKGEPVGALVTDRHWIHIPEHAGTLSSPEARENAAAMAAVSKHVQEHAELLRAADPLVLAMQGCPPGLLQMISMSMTPVSAPGVPGATEPPTPGEPSSSAPPLGPAGPLPQQPVEPVSGERMPEPGMQQ